MNGQSEPEHGAHHERSTDCSGSRLLSLALQYLAEIFTRKLVSSDSSIFFSSAVRTRAYSLILLRVRFPLTLVEVCLAMRYIELLHGKVRGSLGF